MRPAAQTRPAALPGQPAADAGFVGGFAGLLFGFLLFIAGTLMAANAWGVVDTKNATAEAARQAIRTYVEAPNATIGWRDAEQAASQALVGYGRDPGRAQMALLSGGFARCARVTIEVSYPAPAVLLPFVGRVGTGHLVRAAQSELIYAFGSGLPGMANCP